MSLERNLRDRTSFRRDEPPERCRLCCEPLHSRELRNRPIASHDSRPPRRAIRTRAHPQTPSSPPIPVEVRVRVGVDETFVGGVSIGRSAASTTKATVMVAVEKPGPGRKLGRIRLGLADRPNTLGLVAFATNSVMPGSTIHTAGARMMRRLSELGYTHEYATGYNAPDPAAVLPGVHLTASLLKRRLTGTLHYGVAEHQLPYYLDEFTFRFNRRNATSRGLLFYRLLQQAVHTDPHPLDELLDPFSNPYL
ncbi:hypothetical protein GB864_09320 [Agromyces sp. MMS17-SY077]|uniref:ISXO2-like transposase domain-containing protein n=1 Tax=Agromyces seonyuensis TaxID=2662446 RepID=A0A6I4NWS7_9MICO|nr:hypothetical protein [Agromyces seonyuensis]